MTHYVNCSSRCAIYDTPHLMHHVVNKIPALIKYAQLSILPSREAFLDPVMAGSFRAHVQRGEPILFKPCSIAERLTYVGRIPVYTLYMFGIIPDGSKTCVRVDNVTVYLDVMVPNGVTAEAYGNSLRADLIAVNIPFKSMEQVDAFKFHDFQERKRPYMRIHFNNLRERKSVIDYIADLNKATNGAPLETASDDYGAEGYYFIKTAREYRFKTADWNRIDQYKVLNNEKHQVTTNCTYNFAVDVRNIKELTNEKRAAIEAGPLRECVKMDRLITCMWDIETYRTIQNGVPPVPGDTDYTIFMICSAFFYFWSDTPLFDVCCVCAQTVARQGVGLTIQCETELDMLLADIEVKARMAADIYGAFNGGNFDWPLVVDKLKQYRRLVHMRSRLSSLPHAETEESVAKWSFKSEKVKIDAETVYDLKCVANIPGFVDTDVLPVFVKLYPRMEVRRVASLNFFLQSNELPSKADMPYKKMFKIYERAMKLAAVKACHCAGLPAACTICLERVKEIDCVDEGASNVLHPDLLVDGRPLCCFCGKLPRNLRDMGDVGYYCVIDCIRPQQLYVKRTIVSDKCSLSCMSFVSLYDSFYRADGMKVRNLIGSACYEYSIAFSNKRSGRTRYQKDHYPGGWVFHPERGLHNDRPITGIDYASLYPSLMMCYNYSPDMIVRTQSEADRLIALGYTLHRIEPFDYEVGEEKAKPGNRHCVAAGWTVRHNGVFNPTVDTNIILRYEKEGRGVYRPVYGRKALTNERMGVLAICVKKLFDRRVPLKSRFGYLSEEKERMEKDLLAGQQVDPREYAEVCFEREKVDSEQRALKILTNTFYGESGNYKSSIYDLLVAGGITCSGQYNIKLVNKFVTELGFKTKYGDSVTGDTPILCKVGNFIGYRPIAALGGVWGAYDDKESSPCDCEVWTDMGFTRVRRVIRHKSSGDIYRVLTGTGCVDVTSDHSLLDPRGNKVKPTDLCAGQRLLHADLPQVEIRCFEPVLARWGADIVLRDKLEAANLYLAASVYGPIGLDARAGDAFMITSGLSDEPDRVRRVINLGPCADYVYDLETDNHHFSAGIGRLVVHNTDSLYIKCPDAVYRDADAEYEAAVCETDGPSSPESKLAARIKYWTEMVQITMGVMNDLKCDILDHLLNDNGTLFLNMAYEEVGFPTIFCGKKKYCMIAHIKMVNFYPKKLFIKGIDIVKQGQAEISKNLGQEFMREALGPENYRDIINIAEDKIRKFYAMFGAGGGVEHVAQFTLSGRYRPEKKNVPVLTFVRRMVAMRAKYADDITLLALYEPPEPGDKFDYVIVKKPQMYTLRGQKIEMKKGDQMEYVRAFIASQTTANPMEINLDYYMKSYIVGLFARFIAYYGEFQPSPAEVDLEDYKEIDKYCIKKATKWLENLCDAITGVNRALALRQGINYRSIYRSANKQLRYDIVGRNGGAALMLGAFELHDDLSTVARSSRVVDQIKRIAAELSQPEGFGAEYLAAMRRRERPMDIWVLNRIYASEGANLASRHLALCAEREESIIADMYKLMHPVIEIISRYETSLIALIDDMRTVKTEDMIDLTEENIAGVNVMSVADRGHIDKLYGLVVTLTAVYKMRNRIVDLIDAIKTAIHRSVGAVANPLENVRRVAREEARHIEVLEEYVYP